MKQGHIYRKSGLRALVTGRRRTAHTTGAASLAPHRSTDRFVHPSISVLGSKFRQERFDSVNVLGKRMVAAILLEVSMPRIDVGRKDVIRSARVVWPVNVVRGCEAVKIGVELNQPYVMSVLALSVRLQPKTT